jgi:hypothetical protein
LALGFAALFGPYMLFNMALSGTPMPNTFYAKQAEYAGLSLLERFFVYIVQLLTGPILALLLGLGQKIHSAIQRREWGILLAVVWVVGYILLYFFRLPAYQHGRYLMPAMSIALLVGLMGFYEFLPSLRTYRTRLARQIFLTAVVTFSLVFAGYGAYTYGQDVGFIETEMVASAKWANKNIPPQALIAAHDIGALGFFDHHDLIDLAGLISPEVVPFIRDEAKLAAYLDQSQVEYLIVFSGTGWYLHLTQRGTVVFDTNGHFSSDNITIYRWNKP